MPASSTAFLSVLTVPFSPCACQPRLHCRTHRYSLCVPPVVMRTSFPHAPSSSDTTPAQSEQLPTAHVPMRGNNNGDGINRSGGGEPPDNSPDIDDPSLPPHWHVAIAASLIHALHATAIYMGPATLLSPMRLSLDLSVEQITRPLIAFRSIQAIFLLPAGYVLDLFGPQRCLRFAMTAAAILAPFLPLVTSLSQLVVLQALCGLTKAFGGLSAMILLTNLRFAHRRGLATATGFVLSGYSLAGFFAPAVIGVVAQSYGWRFALGALSLGFAVTALPLTFYYCREPQHRYRGVTLRSLWTTMRKKGGLKGGNASAVAHDGGGEGVVSSPSSVASSEDLRRRLGKRFGDSAGGEPSAAPLNHADLNHANEPLIQPAYVTVMVAVSAFSFAMHIVLDHLLVFLREDFGMPFETATLYISALNLVALFAKLAVGPLAERFNMSLLMAAFALLGVFSSTLLLDVSMAGIAVTASVTKVIAFVGLFSTSYAALFGLTTMLLPEFGQKKLGVRSNINLMLLFGMGSVGSYAAGLLRSSVGSYKWAFVWNAACYVVVLFAALFKYFIFDKNDHPSFAASAGKNKVDTA